MAINALLLNTLHPVTSPHLTYAGFPIVFCLCAYSLTITEQLTSWHSLFRLAGSSLVANSSPLARSTASTGTSKSVNGFLLSMRALGRTKAPSATFPPILPSSAKMTL